MTTLRDLMRARYGAPTDTRSNGEVHYPCPQCGGEDRFLVRPDGIHGYCRQCHWQPDAIQYLREIEGKSYQDAAAEVGKELPPQDPRLQAHERRLRQQFLSWRNRLWVQTYQALRVAHERLISVQFAQQCFQLAPSTFTPEEKAFFASELLDAEIDFQAHQEAFLLMGPDAEMAMQIWEEIL